jgi:hypothetical protein
MCVLAVGCGGREAALRAVASVTAWEELRDAARLLPSAADRTDLRPGALAWLPFAAAGLGLVAALVAFGLGRWSALLGGGAGLIVLRTIEGGRPGGRVGLGLLVLEALALLGVPTPVQVVALALAPVLGAWSRVVQCHGGRLPSGLAGPSMVGRASFREFGWASVTAIGGALACFDALGLVAVLGAVVPTLTLRLTLHARHGGMPPWGPALSARVAEAVVIVVVALLAGAGRGV